MHSFTSEIITISYFSSQEHSGLFVEIICWILRWLASLKQPKIIYYREIVGKLGFKKDIYILLSANVYTLYINFFSL